MGVANLGNTWHQDALWEKKKPVEALGVFGQCSAKKLGPTIQVDATLRRPTSQCTIVDLVHLFMETTSPDGWSLFQQDNAPYWKINTVQVRFEEHEFEISI